MMRFLHWSTHFFFFFCITVQTHVLLSLGGTKRLTSTKPSFPPRGLKTRMSHLPWGACFYRPVTLDPFLPWDLQICPSRGWKKKKIWKGKQRGLILRVMQLDSWSLVRQKELLSPCGHKKLWERNFISQKWGRNVAWWGWGLLFLGRPTFLEKDSQKIIQRFFLRTVCSITDDAVVCAGL